ncbi:HLA class II histocompatibility antigen, DM beta chain-like [Morus bassanus]
MAPPLPRVTPESRASVSPLPKGGRAGGDGEDTVVASPLSDIGVELGRAPQRAIPDWRASVSPLPKGCQGHIPGDEPRGGGGGGGRRSCLAAGRRAGRREERVHRHPPPAMGVLGVLGLVLSCQGAGAFLMHAASSCLLAANGSVLAFGFTLVFNKNPLVCYAPDARRFVPCDWGLLHNVATVVAFLLNSNDTWAERAEARRQACRDLAPHFWASTALRRTPPQVRIIPVPLPNAPDAVLLTCHVWGFYPPEVSVLWLHNGDTVAAGDTAKVLPNGDWTYRTQVTLTVTANAGDTFTCSVQHAGLDRPVQQHWGPGLSPGLTVKVAVAAAIMTLGLVVFAAGTFSYCRQAPGEGCARGHVWGHGPAPAPAPGSGSCPGPGSDPSPGPGPNPGSGSCPGPGSGPGSYPGPSPGSGPGPGPGPSMATCDHMVTKL